MTRLEQLRDVILMACLNEDRSDSEQRSLLRWAWIADQQANRLTGVNRYWRRTSARTVERTEPLWNLVDTVLNTRLVLTDEGQHNVNLPAKQQATRARAFREWERAAAGGTP